MGIANPTETVLGILAVMDEVRAKMDGTRLAAFPWRPSNPQAAEKLTDLVDEALRRCDDATEAVIVVTVAAMAIAREEPLNGSRPVRPEVLRSSAKSRPPAAMLATGFADSLLTRPVSAPGASNDEAR